MCVCVCVCMYACIYVCIPSSYLSSHPPQKCRAHCARARRARSLVRPRASGGGCADPLRALLRAAAAADQAGAGARGDRAGPGPGLPAAPGAAAHGAALWRRRRRLRRGAHGRGQVGRRPSALHRLPLPRARLPAPGRRRQQRCVAAAGAVAAGIDGCGAARVAGGAGGPRRRRRGRARGRRDRRGGGGPARGGHARGRGRADNDARRRGAVQGQEPVYVSTAFCGACRIPILWRFSSDKFASFWSSTRLGPRPPPSHPTPGDPPQRGVPLTRTRTCARGVRR